MKKVPVILRSDGWINVIDYEALIRMQANQPTYKPSSEQKETGKQKKKTRNRNQRIGI